MLTVGQSFAGDSPHLGGFVVRFQGFQRLVCDHWSVRNQARTQAAQARQARLLVRPQSYLFPTCTNNSHFFSGFGKRIRSFIVHSGRAVNFKLCEHTGEFNGSSPKNPFALKIDCCFATLPCALLR